MQNKSIVVYVSYSYLNQAYYSNTNDADLVKFLTTLVEKRLDFKLSKSVNANIKEIQT